MKTKEEVNKVLKRMFEFHKTNMDSGYYTHEESTENILNSYDDFYEWIIDKKYDEKKTWYDKKQAKMIAKIIIGITITGIITLIIGVWLQNV